jgi:four helix bundle protein
MRIERFQDIEAWQEAKKLAVAIYGLTENKQFNKDFGLRGQIQRAGASVMANIAEGFGRKTNKDFMRFLYISRGSVFEVQSHLEIAKEISYISQKEFDEVNKLTMSTAKLVGGFINYLEKHEK